MSDHDEARRSIVAAAEAHRLTLPRVRIMVRPHTMKRVQWAVFVARQNRLVGADVLAAAGYRP